jgi:1,4-dihydroxy-2-naphthoate octaprenyltransferase
MIAPKSVRMKRWLRALRAHFLTASIAPVLVGTAVAWYETARFDLGLFALALAGAILIHLGANMANDYFDYRSETDARNVSSSAYSGGSRVIQEGLIPARHVLVAAVCCLVAGSLIGFFLVWRLRSVPLLVLGLAGVSLAYFYTGLPVRLAYHGFAEIANGVSFGPILALGAAVVQSGAITLREVLASVPPGLLLASVLMINEFPDYESDRSVGKKTIVVLAGRRAALAVYHAAMLLSCVWVAACAMLGPFPPWTLLSLAAAPLGLQAYRISRRHYEDSRRIVAANRATFLFHLAFNLLLGLGFLL